MPQPEYSHHPRRLGRQPRRHRNGGEGRQCHPARQHPVPRPALRHNTRRARLSASGLDVGLPDGQMGNSEVGHLNLGAGRIVYQDLTRINKAIEDGELAEQPASSPRRFEKAKGTAPPPHRPRLRRRRPQPPGPPHRHRQDRARGRRRRHHASTPSPTAATPRPPAARATSPTCEDELAKCGAQHRHRRRPLLRDGPRQALGAHQARLGRDRPRQGREDATSSPVEAVAEHIRDGQDRRVPAADDLRRRRHSSGSATATSSSVFNFRADRARQLSEAFLYPDFDGFDAHRDARSPLRHPDRIRRDLRLPGRSSRRRRSSTVLGEVVGARRPQAAAHRRDREIPARHLLLQRRRGDSRTTARTAPSSPRRRTCRPTTSSRR